MRELRRASLLIVVAALCSSMACTKSGGDGGSGKAIASAASQGVGVVGQSSSGGSGAPVIVLEERHDSRVGQIQHAITLARLHDKYGLRAIALEGYLRGNPPIKTDWFVRAVAKKDI